MPLEKRSNVGLLFLLRLFEKNLREVNLFSSFDQPLLYQQC